jgi:histidinol-phosphate aminotransferase
VISKDTNPDGVDLQNGRCKANLNPFMSSIVPNSQLAGLPVYIPGKPIDEVAREHGLVPSEVIKLASNENPLGPSPKALRAMEHVLKNLHLYPDGSSFHLKRAIADKLGVSTANLIVGNGSNEILEFVGHAFLSQGDEVVVSQYCFAVYPIVTALFGARLVSVPAVNLAADIPAMLQAITPRTRVVFLANPNNPTGTLTSKADVRRLLEEVPPHVLIALDEAYIEFLDDPFDSLSLVRKGQQSNLLLMRTFSKIYGLAGLRLGYGVANPDLIAAMEKVRQPFNLNAIAQAAALAALDDGEHFEQTRANNRQGVEFFENRFAAWGVPFVKSYANFVLAKVGNGKAVFEELQRRGIITRPMASYDLPEWLRISVGTPVENARCLAALGEILGK